MSDLVGNHIVGFPTRWLNFIVKGLLKEMEMECSGGNSVPDEYEGDTDKEDSLSKSEVLPKNKAGNPGIENIDRMDDELSVSSKTASRYIYIYII